MEGLLPATTTSELLSTVSQLLSDFSAPIFLLCGLLLAGLLIDIFFDVFTGHKKGTASDEDTGIL